jgi:hypothetical protein
MQPFRPRLVYITRHIFSSNSGTQFCSHNFLKQKTPSQCIQASSSVYPNFVISWPFTTSCSNLAWCHLQVQLLTLLLLLASTTFRLSVAVTLMPVSCANGFSGNQVNRAVGYQVQQIAQHIRESLSPLSSSHSHYLACGRCCCLLFVVSRMDMVTIYQAFTIHRTGKPFTDLEQLNAFVWGMMDRV